MDPRVIVGEDVDTLYHGVSFVKSWPLVSCLYLKCNCFYRTHKIFFIALFFQTQTLINTSHALRRIKVFFCLVFIFTHLINHHTIHVSAMHIKLYPLSWYCLAWPDLL